MNTVTGTSLVQSERSWPLFSTHLSPHSSKRHPKTSRADVQGSQQGSVSIKTGIKTGEDPGGCFLLRHALPKRSICAVFNKATQKAGFHRHLIAELSFQPPSFIYTRITPNPQRCTSASTFPFWQEWRGCSNSNKRHGTR